MLVSHAHHRSQQIMCLWQRRWWTRLPQKQMREATTHVPHLDHHEKLPTPRPGVFTIHPEVRVSVTKAAELCVQLLATYS